MVQQRPSAAVADSHSRPGSQQAGSDLPGNHLLPASLGKVPEWFHDSPFRYNLRLAVGFLPGALLVSIVAGKLMVAAVLMGGLGTLAVRSTGLAWPASVLSIAHVFLLEVVNVYCMVPLIWRSVLNVPLLVIFHFLIALTGMWWWLQDSEFRKQDARFSILLERIIFYCYPAISIITVTWVCGMLFGRTVVPFALCLAGVAMLSLYVVPLKSSFAKPQSPTDVGLIQHRVVAWVYLALAMCLPAVVHAALNMDTSCPHSWLSLALLVVSPPFLATLLEAQGLFYWIGLGPASLRLLRWVSGLLVLLLVSAVLYASRPSSLLPLLTVPVLFTQLSLVSAIESSPPSSSSSSSSSSSLPSLVLSAMQALLYCMAFVLLPWSISHYFSFVPLPLSAVQLLLWGLALASIAMVTQWKRVTPLVWILYNGVFIDCEFLLSFDGVYPPYFAMVTGVVATILYWRFHSVGHMTLTTSLVCVCLHVTKLSLLFPPALTTLTPFNSTLTLTAAIFLVSFPLLRVLVFETPPTSLTAYHIAIFCFMLLAGLSLCLTQVWTVLTNQEPTSSNIAEAIAVAVGVFLHHGYSVVQRHRDGWELLGRLPPFCFTLAVLVWLLQPEVNFQELSKSVVMVVFEDPQLPADIILTAWTNVLVWMIFVTAVGVFIAVLSNVNALNTVACASYFGIIVGLLACVKLLHYPPFTVMGVMYATVCCISAVLLARAYTAASQQQQQQQRRLVDKILFAVVCVLSLVVLWLEYTELPLRHVMGRPAPLPCAWLLLLLSLSLAVAYRASMYYCQEQPYLPVVANICCLAAFLLSFTTPLHHQPEVSTLLSSSVFLLAQPDSLLIPRTQTIFLAPSLVASVSSLYLMAAAALLPNVALILTRGYGLYIAARIAEVVLLLASVPGHLLFLFYLWTGKELKLTVLILVLYIFPNAMLPQFASSTAASLIGSIGIFSFCLIILGHFANVKITA